MTLLCEKMISDMQLYRLARTTQDSYLRAVTGLANYFNKFLGGRSIPLKEPLSILQLLATRSAII